MRHILAVLSAALMMAGCTVPEDGTGTDPVTIPVTPTDLYPLRNDGTWAVPEDIGPGTYRSSPVGGENCYWARLSKSPYDVPLPDHIIEDGQGPGSVVTILETDRAFMHIRCGGWRRVNL